MSQCMLKDLCHRCGCPLLGSLPHLLEQPGFYPFGPLVHAFSAIRWFALVRGLEPRFVGLSTGLAGLDLDYAPDSKARETSRSVVSGAMNSGLGFRSTDCATSP